MTDSARCGRVSHSLLISTRSTIARANTLVGISWATSMLVAPSTGELKIAVKTQSGHATLRLDTNQDGKFAESERIIGETPKNGYGPRSRCKQVRSMRCVSTTLRRCRDR